MAILGLDIGGTKTAVLLASSDGQIHRREQFLTHPSEGFDSFLERLLPAVRSVCESGSPSPECASISIGGPMIEDEGLLICPPHLPTWEDLPLRDRLADALEMPVMWMHDARAGAFAEWLFGAGSDPKVRSLAFITFATGFGCGIVLGGRLLPIPGEIGHWRVAEDGPELFGKRGSLEGLCSGTGMSLAAQATGRFPEGVKVEDLAGAARRGDPAALTVFDTAAREVGLQCARLNDLFGLDVIALGTIAIHAGDLLLDRIREVAAAEALPRLASQCEITAAKVGDRIGDLACLSAALYSGYREPGETGPAGPSAMGQMTELTDLALEVHADRQLLARIDEAARLCTQALADGNQLLACGNGGSSTQATHLVEELTGRYRGHRRSLPAVSLSCEGAVLTCVANDYGFDEVFARQIEGLGRPGDVLVAFTTSGKSRNVNRAIECAGERGLKTIAVTGKSGGEAAELADLAIVIPSANTARIQEIHTFILHAICEAAEARFAGRE